MPASSNLSTRSRTDQTLTQIDWSALSKESRQTIQTIGSMVASGLAAAEIARRLGKSRPWVSARLRELRREIEEQLTERSELRDGDCA